MSDEKMSLQAAKCVHGHFSTLIRCLVLSFTEKKKKNQVLLANRSDLLLFGGLFFSYIFSN